MMSEWVTRLRARKGRFVTLAWVASVWRRGGRVSVSPPRLFLPRVWFLARLCYDGNVAAIFVW